MNRKSKPDRLLNKWAGRIVIRPGGGTRGEQSTQGLGEKCPKKGNSLEKGNEEMKVSRGTHAYMRRGSEPNKSRHHQRHGTEGRKLEITVSRKGSLRNGSDRKTHVE